MLGSNSSSMLPYIAVASSFFPPPPPMSSKQVHFSSSFESLTDDLKVVLDFFLGSEIISLRLNLSLGVSSSVYVFN